MKILIVDDEEFIGKILSRFAKTRDIEADVAGTGQEALELTAKNEYAAACIDVHLNYESGEDLAVTLGKEYPGMRIILMSGLPENDFGNEACIRYDGYIFKPNLAQEFLPMLEKLGIF